METRNRRGRTWGSRTGLLGSIPVIDELFAAVGTGGTIMGVGLHVRRRDPHVRIVAVESSEMDIEGMRNTRIAHRGSSDLYQLDLP